MKEGLTPEEKAEAVKNIGELADFVESAKFLFEMHDSSANPACGSAGCIGGHAAVLWPEVRRELSEEYEELGIFTWRNDGLMEKLGLTYDEQQSLCFMTEVEQSYSDVTREKAVKVLRILGESGTVQWSKAIGRD